ncbi:MAG: hypothetical protein Q8L98_01840 [Chlamydiales bacterium]|nr:hypothetical protein [Chlamydiales bacterium]
MSHISGASPKFIDFLNEDSTFLEIDSLPVNSLEQKTQEVALPVLVNSQDEFGEWDSFNAENDDRGFCTNDEMPSVNLAFKDIDYEPLNFLNSEESLEDNSPISTSSIVVEKQNHKQKRCTNKKDEETREPNHRHFGDEREYQNFLNQGLLTDDLMEDSNPNSFLTSQAMDASEKSIEQTAFDERFYTNRRFDSEQEYQNFLNHGLLPDDFIEDSNPNSFLTSQAIDTSEKSIEQTAFDERFYTNRRFDDAQEYQNFLNQGLLTDDFMEDSNVNNFLTSQALDTSEKSIEQTAFDERFYATSPLRFDEPQTETSAFLENQNHKRKRSTNPKDEETRKPNHRHFGDEQEYQNFLNQGLLPDDLMEDSNPNSFLTSQAFDTSEKSIEQTAFDERFYATSPLRFDEQQTATPVFAEKEENCPNANLWERTFQRLPTISPARVNDKPAEASTKKPRSTPAIRPSKKNYYIKRTLKEYALIERVLTSDVISPDEQKAKEILRRRKRTPPTLREVEMCGFSNNFRLLNLWLLNQPLSSDEEKDVKEKLLLEIKRYREKWGTWEIEQADTATDT